MEEKIPNEKESLSIITEMIQKAKEHFHESGSSAILWGSVVAICGLTSFAERQWGFSLPFDVWLCIFFAVIPQIVIIIREKKKRMVKSHQSAATDIVWMVYAISIAGVVLYQLFVPGISDKQLAENGIQLLEKNTATGEISNFHYFIPAISSIYLIIYAFPTMATGLINQFKPMIWGALLCYVFFGISLFVPFKYDMLLMALAGIVNWLIPGLILRKRFLNKQAC